MFNLNLDDLVRGYSNEQYSEAEISVIIQFLVSKGVIDESEYLDFREEHLSTTLDEIIVRDKAIKEKELEEIKTKRDKHVKELKAKLEEAKTIKKDKNKEELQKRVEELQKKLKNKRDA